MAIYVAKGQITITDTNDARSFQSFIGSNLPTTQIYNKDTDVYIPDWTESPWLILTPQLYISGVSGDSMSTPGRIKAGSTKWFRDGVELTDGGDYSIETTAPFKLTVKKNENGSQGAVKYTFKGVMIETGSELEIDFSSDISFTTMQNVSVGLIAVAIAPEGVTFHNDTIPTLSLRTDLFRGNSIDDTLVTYMWGVMDGGIFSPTTITAPADTTTNKVKVNSITNMLVGSEIKILTEPYTITDINTDTFELTLNKNLTVAISSGHAVTSPYYDPTLGVNWAKIDTNSRFNGITGFSTNTIIVPNGAVLNRESFKCAIKDVDSNSPTHNQVVSDIISLVDISDPFIIDLVTPNGTSIKNGIGSANITARVWRGGIEVDPDGTEYDYVWTRYNANGDIDSTFTPTTKTITITPAHIAGGKTMLNCELWSKD